LLNVLERQASGSNMPSKLREKDVIRVFGGARSAFHLKFGRPHI
jgi:hypothetical protein